MSKEWFDGIVVDLLTQVSDTVSPMYGCLLIVNAGLVGLPTKDELNC